LEKFSRYLVESQKQQVRTNREKSEAQHAFEIC
jgi:hypothetical protein